jgi:hypothetical protein
LVSSYSYWSRSEEKTGRLKLPSERTGQLSAQIDCTIIGHGKLKGRAKRLANFLA